MHRLFSKFAPPYAPRYGNQSKLIAYSKLAFFEEITNGK